MMPRQTLKETLEAEIRAETVEECCLLAVPSDLLGYLSYAIHTFLSRDGTAHSGLSYMNCQSRKYFTGMPTGQSHGGNSSAKGSSFQVCQSDNQD